MVGTSQVDLNRIDTIMLCFTGKISRSQMYNDIGHSLNALAQVQSPTNTH